MAFPVELLPDVREHLEHFAGAGRDGHVFIGPRGTPRAALIYQHMVNGRDREIADRWGAMIRKTRSDVDS